MSRPRIGQQLVMAIALGLFLLPSVSWAVTTIQHPFVSATATPASLSILNSLSIANDGMAAPNTTYFGTLDLKNNDLIVHPSAQTAAAALANYQAIYDMIRSGADVGAYDQTGVSSTTVAADATQKGGLALGILLNDDGTGTPIWGGAGSDLGAFDGNTSLNQFDTIVKYTFLGDSFLEGAVSQSDVLGVFPNLGKFPANNSATTQAWQAGDFFYQSQLAAANPNRAPVNQSDYSSAFSNLSAQSTYPYSFAQPAAGLSVPEPSTLLALVIGVGLMLGRFVVRK
jgi:hypothetical protein